MKRLMLVSAFAAFAANCTGAIETETLEGGGTALKVSGSAYTEEELTALVNNEVTELWKVGDATLVSDGIEKFSGTIRVKGGILQVNNETGLGVIGNDTYVESGSTLEFKLSRGIYSYPDEMLHLSGTGVDSKGAIYVSAGDVYLGKFTLEADALVTSAVAFHFFEKPITMNGHTLTINMGKASQTLEFKPTSITTPGHLVMERGILKANGKMDGEESNTITVSASAQLEVMASGIKWKVILPKDAGSTGKLWFFDDTDAHDLSYDGPVEYENGFDGITGTWTTGAWGYMRMAFNGQISGDGSFYSRFLWDTTKENHYVELNNTNTFTGTLHVKDCTAIRAKYPESIPDLTKVSFVTPAENYNQLVLDLATEENPAGWTGTKLSDALKYLNRTDFPNARVLVGARNGDEGVATGLVFGASKQIVLGSIGPGSTKIGAKFSNDDLVINSPNNAVILSAPADEDWSSAFASFLVQYGVCRFEDAGYVPIGSLNMQVGCHPDYGTARLTVGSGSVISCDYPALGTTGTAKFEIGGTGDGHDGIIETRGGTITNNLKLASRILSAGALYVNGGEYFSTGLFGDQTAIGVNSRAGHGYAEVNSGKFTSYGMVRIGCNSGAKGLLYQKGGKTSVLPNDKFTELMEVGYGGTGVVYQTGGEIDLSGTKHLIINGSTGGAAAAAATPGKGIVTIDGDGAKLNAKRVVMGERKGEAILNVLNGGTLETGYVFHNKYQIYVEQYGEAFRNYEGEITGDTEYVNFDGGIFKYRENDGRSADLFGITFREEADGDTKPKYVTIHSGGMTVDTAGANKTLSAPLLKPKAGGVTGLKFQEGTSSIAGYITAPYVDIQGAGQGASAVAIFDSTSGCVTGVKVTSPGWGYEAGTTKAYLTQCGQRPRTEVELQVTVSDPAATGGFTKCGLGTLTLTAANEFLGNVKVSGGTLKLAAGASIASTATLEVEAGATFEAETGAEYAPSTITGAGIVKGLDITLPAEWQLSAADLMAGNCLTTDGALTIPAGAELSVDDVSMLGQARNLAIARASGGISGDLPTLTGDLAEDPHWQVSKGENGELLLRYVHGMRVIIR